MFEPNLKQNEPLLKNLITILGNLLDCGLLDPVSNAIEQHRDWFETLDPQERKRAFALRERLEASRRIEVRHGVGCLLDLCHPTVNAMIKWKRVTADMIANAEQFGALGQSK